MDYQVIIGYLASAAALVSYILYFRDIFNGHTKPHAFSWLTWSLLAGITFGIQIQNSAGAGSWVVGVTSFMCFCIFLLALFRGEKNIVKFDVVCLAGASGALLLWLVIDQPLFSVILVSIIYFFGYLPTFRKTYRKPHEETVMTFILSATKYSLSLIALNNFIPLTFLFPLSAAVMDVIFVTMVLIRRNKLKPKKI